MELLIDHITKNYGTKNALNEIHFSLTKGVYGLLGPNGAGKSTLMNIIVGLMPPSSGQVLWNGEEIGKLGESYRKCLGYVPQQQTLYPEFTAKEFLGYMCALQEIDKSERADRIETVLRQVYLSDAARGKIKTFSGGMKQRLLIAQALLGEPELLVLDEPTAGLDPKQRIQIRKLLAKEGEKSIVLIATHVVSDVDRIAKEILFIKQGQLIEKDSPDSLVKKYTDAFADEQVSSLEDVYLHLYGDGVFESNVL